MNIKEINAKYNLEYHRNVSFVSFVISEHNSASGTPDGVILFKSNRYSKHHLRATPRLAL